MMVAPFRVREVDARLIRVQNYRQTCCQRQFPNWSQIWACRQDVVPSGGIVGGLIGAIEGATGPHIPMHDGAISRALLQRGCIRPLTHWQVHPACTCELNAHKAKAMMTRILIDTPFSKAPINFVDDINERSVPRHPVHADFLLPARWPSVLWQWPPIAGQ
jgi:hypothetical protein